MADDPSGLGALLVSALSATGRSGVGTLPRAGADVDWRRCAITRTQAVPGSRSTPEVAVAGSPVARRLVREVVTAPDGVRRVDVVGPGGHGKTTLLDALAAAFGQAGIEVRRDLPSPGEELGRGQQVRVVDQDRDAVLESVRHIAADRDSGVAEGGGQGVQQHRLAVASGTDHVDPAQPVGSGDDLADQPPGGTGSGHGDLGCAPGAGRHLRPRDHAPPRVEVCTGPRKSTHTCPDRSEECGAVSPFG